MRMVRVDSQSRSAQRTMDNKNNEGFWIDPSPTGSLRLYITRYLQAVVYSFTTSTS